MTRTQTGGEHEAEVGEFVQKKIDKFIKKYHLGKLHDDLEDLEYDLFILGIDCVEFGRKMKNDK